MRQPKTAPLAPLISVKKLSQKSTGINHLLTLASKHQSFDNLLDQSLPELYRGKFRVNTLQGDKLILTCASAKLMTKFRFIQDQVINNLNLLIAPKKINTIQIKIRPDFNTNRKKAKANKPSRTISKKNAQILLEEAEHTEDQNLRNILTNLANHANNN